NIFHNALTAARQKAPLWDWPYLLPAKYVIHTVGPVWNGGMEGQPELLASCYRRSLELADQHGVRSIAFPAISCGIFGYPIELAAQVAWREVRQWLDVHSLPERVVFCCYSESDAAIYRHRQEALHL
ncbi:MAG: macro domain-containing protein, partial [Verrucomicrobia bacterium]|nr:macro domain-containing protein [Verrucomicrobiota bacterium]